MLYRSSSCPEICVSLHEAVRHSVRPDGGIYLPERIPYIPRAFFNNIAEMSLADIGYVVANMLFGEEINSATLKQIVSDAVNFDIPLRPLAPHMYSLELYHGPSGSYKDFGARFMAHLHTRFMRAGQSSNILIATRGDAGEAVARGFFGMDNVKVFVVYPQKPDLSVRRRTDFAQLGGNIVPVEVRGTFEQCLELVRRASADTSFPQGLDVMAANSFNIARLLPQTFYYYYAYARLMRETDSKPDRLVISIPAGNLGNLTAGLIAKRMGLPVERFIVARDDSPYFLSDYLDKGILPEMTAAIPPNFQRLRSLYGDDHKALARDVEVAAYPPERVAEILAADSSSILDPTGKLARKALEERLRPGETGIVLATTSPSDPPQAQRQHRHQSQLPASYESFREYLIKNALH